MIDASEARRIARQTIADARAFYGIDPAWDITLDLLTLAEGHPARVEVLPDYRRANIWLCPTECGTVQDVRRHMAHEVAHVMVSEYRVYRDLVDARHGEDATLHQAFTTADERTVRLLEQLFMRERPAPKARAFKRADVKVLKPGGLDGAEAVRRLRDGE